MYADMLNAMGVSTREVNKAVLNEDTWPVPFSKLRINPTPGYHLFRIRDDFDAEELANHNIPWPEWDLYSHRTFGMNHSQPEDPEELVVRMAAAVSKQPKIRRSFPRELQQQHEYVCMYVCR